MPLLVVCLSVLALGAIAHEAVLDHARRVMRVDLPSPRPEFAHGARWRITRKTGERTLISSYHVSQQNTQTGRLTPAMFDRVLEVARRVVMRDNERQ